MGNKEDSFIPAAVKKQEKAALKAQKAAKAAKEPAPVVAPEPVEPVAEPVAPVVKPVTEPAIPVVKTEPATPVKAPEKGDFEHKYNVLQGMYNRETHELKSELDGLKTSMGNQQKIIDNLNNVIEALPAQAAAQPAAAIAPAIKVLDSSLFDGYGTEMVDAIDIVNQLAGRVSALETAKPSAQAAPDQELANRVNNIEATQQVTVKDTFYDALGSAMPTWGEQNHDPLFKAWLEEIDPLSQLQRKVMLKFAFDRYNHKQVIALFKAFPGAKQAVAPVEPAAGLEGQVVPETTGNAGGGPGGQPPKVYSTKEEFLEAQEHFTKGRITEADFDKVANSYQLGIAAAQK